MSVLYRVFVAVAIAEAGSWLGLLAGMYVKYLGSGNEIGVKIFGPVHGALFMIYVGCVLVMARGHAWSVKKVALGLACSIPPLASIWFERRVARDRRARDEEPVPATA
ncbi:MAG: DUF3817 domain-containing protein [Stackebrandtia sp.]